MREDALTKNEALCREVNERIEAVSEAFTREDEAMEFLCECDRRDCRENVYLSRAEYESVRAESRTSLASTSPRASPSSRLARSRASNGRSAITCCRSSR